MYLNGALVGVQTFVCLILAISTQAGPISEVPDKMAPGDTQELRRALDEQRQLIEQQTKVIEQQGAQIRRLDELVSDIKKGAQSTDNTELETLPSELSVPGPESSFSLTSGTVTPSQTGTAASRLELGYDKGFVISSPDGLKGIGTDVPFRLKINSWFQLRHTHFDSDGPNRDENDLEFERLRLLFSGHAFTPDLRYFIQLDGDDDQGDAVDVLDYYISYDIGHHDLCLEPGRLGIRAGKWKVPFNRTRHTSGLRLQFADRSMASVFFDVDRSVGLGLFGDTELHHKPVSWELALVNGIRTNQFRSSRQGDLDRNPGVTARVATDLIGEWGADEESDLSWHDCPAVRVGGGFAFSRENRNDALREFSSQRVVDSGVTLSSVLPPQVDEYSIFLYSVDANFKYHGLSILSEYYFRHLTSFSGAPVDDLFDHGFLIQSGYFLVPKKLEAFARWSRIVGDSGTLGLKDHSADEWAGGMAWFIRGPNLKLVFDATHINGAPISDRALNIIPGDDGWLFRTQFQFWF